MHPGSANADDALRFAVCSERFVRGCLIRTLPFVECSSVPTLYHTTMRSCASVIKSLFDRSISKYVFLTEPLAWLMRVSAFAVYVVCLGNRHLRESLSSHVYGGGGSV